MTEMPDNILAIFGDADEKTRSQARDVAVNAQYVSLMADNHLGYIMPIGGVAAYENMVSVVGVGFDIACGNIAIKTDINFRDEIARGDVAGRDWTEVANQIVQSFNFGIGQMNRDRMAPTGHGLFDNDDWDAIPANVREELRNKAINQLGTIGGGNHYVDIFYDEDTSVWVGVHFGSRGFGHSVASGFMALAQGRDWGERVPEQETLLDLDGELGQRYWTAMNLAGEYAYLGREYVARKVVRNILGANVVDIVHNHHNFAWREDHYGRELIVVRKGATPAYPGQRSFVGGSMGDDAYILEGATYCPLGREYEDSVTQHLQRRALYSTVHGAGRIMSRSQAKGSRSKLNKATGERTQKRKGEITRQMMGDWTRKRNIVVRGGDVDEAPHVYRRLDEVVKAQLSTVTVVHRLTPIVVVMAGANVPRDD